jgi:hypothetical protein
MNLLTPHKTVMECAAGASLFHCIREAISWSMDNETNVEFTHNERVYIVEYRNLIFEIDNQHSNK